MGSSIIQQGQLVFSEAGMALQQISDNLGVAFENAVELLLKTKGRVVVSGIGKSAVIAQKISATLNSTGTPSLMLHAADALHGDLGMVQGEDLVLIISKSGDSPEITSLIPHIRRAGNTIIALCGNKDSYLARHSDCLLDVSVEREACPLNLAPTTSTTAQLVMGDALAVCLLSARGFSREDFARFHPGGILGKKLYLRLQDVISNVQAGIPENLKFKDIISRISNGRQGAVAVVLQEKVVGIITDGDIRRLLEKESDFLSLTASQIMNPKPVCLPADSLAVVGVECMNEKKISQIIITKDEKYAGIVHLHDLHTEGLF